MAYSCETQAQILHEAVKVRKYSPPYWVKELLHLAKKRKKARRRAQRAARKKNRGS